MNTLSPAYQLLEGYQQTIWDTERPEIAHQMLELARSGRDPTAAAALLYVLNSEGDADIRLAIVDYLHSTHSPRVVGGLAKALFDGAPKVRARAAEALAEYKDASDIEGALSALLDAVSDPATRSPTEVAIRTITGRSPEKITVSERERVRLGERASSIWPEHFSSSRSENDLGSPESQT